MVRVQAQGRQKKRGLNQLASLKGSFNLTHKKNSSCSSSQYINVLETVNGNLEIRSGAQGAQTTLAGGEGRV